VLRALNNTEFGALAQLGERLLCKQDVIGSIPIGSTILFAPPARAQSMNKEHKYSCKGVVSDIVKKGYAW
jgi:hypothetical protein